MNPTPVFAHNLINGSNYVLYQRVYFTKGIVKYIQQRVGVSLPLSNIQKIVSLLLCSLIKLEELYSLKSTSNRELIG